MLIEMQWTMGIYRAQTVCISCSQFAQLSDVFLRSAIMPVRNTGYAAFTDHSPSPMFLTSIHTTCTDRTFPIKWLTAMATRQQRDNDHSQCSSLLKHLLRFQLKAKQYTQQRNMLDKEALGIHATELIALLDRYLDLRGETIYSSNEDVDDFFATLGTYLQQNLLGGPASFDVFPAIDLEDHLPEHDRERKVLSALDRQISQICQSDEILEHAKQMLARDYAALKPDTNVDLYRSIGIAEMLRLLRTEETKAREPVEEKFEIKVVGAIELDGTPARLVV